MTDPERPRLSDLDEATDPVQELLRLAGPRPEPSPQIANEVHDAVRRRWRHRVAARARSRRIRWLAAAAVVAAAGAGGWWWRATVGSAEVVARVERGAAQLAGPRARVAEVVEGSVLHPGDVIETGREGLLALRLVGGGSFRLDRATRASWRSAGLVELSRGAVYLDSEGGSGIRVRTPYGDVVDVGTQLEVRVGQETLRLRVREGTARLERGSGVAMAAAGEELRWSAGQGLARDRVARWGAPWAWTLEAAPPLDPRGMTLRQLLARITRETGWQVRFQPQGLEETMGGQRLFGTVPLPPAEAAEVLLPAFGLRSQLSRGVLTVREAEGATPTSGAG